jgi:hypothetical protein
LSRYLLFDRDRIALRGLAERGHDLCVRNVLPLTAAVEPFDHPEFGDLTAAIVAARAAGRPVVLFLGGHPIKLGLSRYLVDMIERGLVTHLATNGSGIIHDFELAAGEGTSEDVPRWIQAGQFGLWRETGRLNDIIRAGAARGEGLGEAVGRVIEEDRFPHRDLSIAAAGWRCGVPVTSHVGIGSDIIHAHANCNGAALGATSYTDFLIFAQAIAGFEHGAIGDCRLENGDWRTELTDCDSPQSAIGNQQSAINNPSGVFLNIGSAVAGPEVYLKALAMARNVARQRGREIRRFTTAVFDLVELPADYRRGPPAKDHPQYYYRPWKTILVRTVADGGHSFYFQGDHKRTIPALWRGTVDAVTRRGHAA